MRTTQGVRWLTEEEAHVRVGPVGAAALLDPVGEDEAMEKKAWRLLDLVGEEGDRDREEEN